jgi:hypothetical protein
MNPKIIRIKTTTCYWCKMKRDRLFQLNQCQINSPFKLYQIQKLEEDLPSIKIISIKIEVKPTMFSNQLILVINTTNKLLMKCLMKMMKKKFK